MIEPEDGDAEAPDDGDVEDDSTIEVPFDRLLAERLEEPSSPEAIYEEEVTAYRPISTGDLFYATEVEGRAATEFPHERVLIVDHPSTMRDGATLKSTIRVAPVVVVHGIRRSTWSAGHYDCFPLPMLRDAAARADYDLPHRGWAALLPLSAPVSKDVLSLEQRFGCLSPEGVHLLLQRLVHSDTRVPVNTKTLAATFSPKLVELNMLHTWVEELVPARVERGADLNAELIVAAEQFESFMESSIGDSTVRLVLGEIPKPGQAGRAGEIQRRFNSALSAQRAADEKK